MIPCWSCCWLAVYLLFFSQNEISAFLFAQRKYESNSGLFHVRKFFIQIAKMFVNKFRDEEKRIGMKRVSSTRQKYCVQCFEIVGNNNIAGMAVRASHTHLIKVGCRIDFSRNIYFISPSSFFAACVSFPDSRSCCYNYRSITVWGE